MGFCFFILREMYEKAGLYSFDVCLTLLWFGARGQLCKESLSICLSMPLSSLGQELTFPGSNPFSGCS